MVSVVSTSIVTRSNKKDRIKYLLRPKDADVAVPRRQEAVAQLKQG